MMKGLNIQFDDDDNVVISNTSEDGDNKDWDRCTMMLLNWPVVVAITG